jgi:hypothetical protein
LPDTNTVSEKVTAWTSNRNSKQVGIDWRFTNDQARIKLKRLNPVVNVQDSTDKSISIFSLIVIWNEE